MAIRRKIKEKLIAYITKTPAKKYFIERNPTPHISGPITYVIASNIIPMHIYKPLATLALVGIFGLYALIEF